MLLGCKRLCREKKLFLESNLQSEVVKKTSFLLEKMMNDISYLNERHHGD